MIFEFNIQISKIPNVQRKSVIYLKETNKIMTKS